MLCSVSGIWHCEVWSRPVWGWPPPLLCPIFPTWVPGGGVPEQGPRITFKVNVQWDSKAWTSFYFIFFREITFLEAVIKKVILSRTIRIFGPNNDSENTRQQDLGYSPQNSKFSNCDLCVQLFTQISSCQTSKTDWEKFFLSPEMVLFTSKPSHGPNICHQLYSRIHCGNIRGPNPQLWLPFHLNFTSAAVGVSGWERPLGQTASLSFTFVLLWSMSNPKHFLFAMFKNCCLENNIFHSCFKMCLWRNWWAQRFTHSCGFTWPQKSKMLHISQRVHFTQRVALKHWHQCGRPQPPLKKVAQPKTLVLSVVGHFQPFSMWFFPSPLNFSHHHGGGGCHPKPGCDRGLYTGTINEKLNSAPISGLIVIPPNCTGYTAP